MSVIGQFQVTECGDTSAVHKEGSLWPDGRQSGIVSGNATVKQTTSLHFLCLCH